MHVENINCIAVDWENGAKGSYFAAASNIRVLGAMIAYLINTLKVRMILLLVFVLCVVFQTVVLYKYCLFCEKLMKFCEKLMNMACKPWPPCIKQVCMCSSADIAGKTVVFDKMPQMYRFCFHRRDLP